MIPLSFHSPHSLAAASQSPLQPPPLLLDLMWKSPGHASGPLYLCSLPSLSLYGFKCHLLINNYNIYPKFLLQSSDFNMQTVILSLHLDSSWACEIPLVQNRPLMLHPPPPARLLPFHTFHISKCHHHLDIRKLGVILYFSLSFIFHS